MTFRIARKEFTDMLRDGRFRVLGGLVLTIAALALVAGWRHYTEVERQHVQAQQATRRQWLSQGPRNPHSAAHYGVYAFKPRTRLSLVDTGVDPYVGVAAWLEAHKQNEFKYRPAQDRTTVERFGELTAAQALLVLMPLFIVLVTFSAFTAEREQGTLRSLLSIGVSARELAAGKALGVSAALAVVLVPAAVLAVAGLALTAGEGSALADLPRAALLGACYLGYFAVFLALSLGVSSRVSSSRVALIVLLSFWVVNSLVAARAVADIAAALHPAPSAIEFQRSMQADLNNQAEVQQRLAARRQALLAEYKATSMDAVPINFRGISLEEGERHGNEVFDRHYGQLYDTYAAQDQTASLFGLVAPLLPMRALSMAFAGTDVAHHRAFANAAEDYRRHIQETLNHDIAVNSRDGAVYEAGAELWAQVPEFRYEAPAAVAVAAAHGRDFLVLGGWLALGLAFLASASRQLRVD